MDNPKKTKQFILLLGGLLISLIFLLSFLDAPEYVHCTDLGVCEFLELSADLNNSLQIFGIMNTLKGAHKFIPANPIIFFHKPRAFSSYYFFCGNIKPNQLFQIELHDSNEKIPIINKRKYRILFKFCGELKNYQSNTNDLVDII